MMKKSIAIFTTFFLISVLFITFYSFAQEAITVTTYYPAPYGVYKEIRADALAVGSTYREEPLTNGTLIVSGEVGIGTSNPSAVLEIHPPDSVQTGVGDTPIAKFKRGRGGDNYLAVHADASGVYVVSDSDDTTPNQKDLYLIAQPGTDGRSILFQTAETLTSNLETRLKVLGNGNVIVEENLGIGDDNPSAVLEAHPPDSVQTGLNDTPIAKFKRGWGGDNYLAVYSDVNGVYVVSDTDDTTPNAKDLYIIAQPCATGGSCSGRNIRFQTANSAGETPTTRLTIQKNGEVDINETVRIRGGNPASGKVLTSDSNGRAVWDWGSIPTGFCIFSPTETSCPPGWSRSVIMTQRTIRASVPGTVGNTGGSSNHSHQVHGNTSGGGGGGTIGDDNGASGGHYHSFNVNSNTASSWPPYINCLVCCKD